MRGRRSLPTGLAVLSTLAAMVLLPVPAAVADTATDTYIVQLNSGVSADKVTGKLMGASARVIHTVFQGGIVTLTAAQAQKLAAKPEVKSVHKDAVVRAATTQNGAPWDLDLMDSRTGTLDGTYTYPNDGTGVAVYVIDSGIMRSHSQFSGATIAAGINFVPTLDPDSSCGAAQIKAGTATADLSVKPANTNDEAGHGTSVSSLITGSTLGASKGVTLVPVRVLNCDGVGSESSIISAADWIASTRTPRSPAVANLSFGISAADLPAGDLTLETALQGLINSGVSVVAAAGNGDPQRHIGVDACTMVPARLPDAITVASVNQARAQSSFSNYGSCVDLYAPGENVWVADKSSVTAQAQGSGTSFSAPLVTAAVAQVLHDHPAWTPAQVEANISLRASYGVVSGARAANKLVNVGPLGTYASASVATVSNGYEGNPASAVPSFSSSPSSITYQWSRGATPITGATDSTYLLSHEDVGQSVTVTATADGGGYVTTPVKSDPIVVQPALPSTAGVPTIVGSPAVSYTVTANPGAWDPADMALVYQWRRDGAAIQGATASTYAPVAGDVGHVLTVLVSGSEAGYYAASAESAPTATIQGSTSPLAYQAFVKASYQDFLSRQPASSELIAKSEALSKGTVSTSDYLTSLSRSDEWLSAIVTKMYNDTLQREPDPIGLAGWVDALRTNQWTVAQVASFFYASDEYFNDHAHGSGSEWVTQLYEKLLNRSPDPLGLAQWVLQTGQYGRSWVASNFYQSDESRMKRVQALYQKLLFRDPDPVGWAVWKVQVLSTGDLVLATQIAGSQEYWNKAHVRY